MERDTRDQEPLGASSPRQDQPLQQGTSPRADASGSGADPRTRLFQTPGGAAYTDPNALLAAAAPTGAGVGGNGNMVGTTAQPPAAAGQGTEGTAGGAGGAPQATSGQGLPGSQAGAGSAQLPPGQNPPPPAGRATPPAPGTTAAGGQTAGDGNQTTQGPSNTIPSSDTDGDVEMRDASDDQTTDGQVLQAPGSEPAGPRSRLSQDRLTLPQILALARQSGYDLQLKAVQANPRGEGMAVEAMLPGLQTIGAGRLPVPSRIDAKKIKQQFHGNPENVRLCLDQIFKYLLDVVPGTYPNGVEYFIEDIELLKWVLSWFKILDASETAWDQEKFIEACTHFITGEWFKRQFQSPPGNFKKRRGESGGAIAAVGCTASPAAGGASPSTAPPATSSQTLAAAAPVKRENERPVTECPLYGLRTSTESPLTAEQKVILRKWGMCWRCKRGRHLAKDCKAEDVQN